MGVSSNPNRDSKWLQFARDGLVTVDFSTRKVTISASAYFLVESALFSLSADQVLDLPTDTNGSPRLITYNVGTNTFSINGMGVSSGRKTPRKGEYYVAVINREVVFSPQLNAINVIEADGGSASNVVVPPASIKPKNNTFTNAAVLYQGSENYAFTVDFTTNKITFAATGNLIVHDGYDNINLSMASITPNDFTFNALSSALMIGFDPSNPTQLVIKKRSESKDVAGKRFWCIARIWDGRVASSNPAVVRVVGGKHRALPPESVDDTSLQKPLRDKINGKVGRNIAQFLRDELEHPSKPVKIKILGSSSVAGNGGTGYSPTGEQIGDTTYKANEAGYCWVNSLKQYIESRYNKPANEVAPDNRFFKVEGEGAEISGSSRFSSADGARLGVYRRYFGLNTKITIPFYGDSFKVYYTKGSSVYDMNLVIDGVQTAVIPGSSVETLLQQSYEKTGLGAGYHEAVITPIQNGKDATTGRMIIESYVFNKKAVVKNWAVSGTYMTWLISNRASLVQSDDTIVWVQMGTNDRNMIPLEGYKQLQRHFIDYAQSLGKEVILSSSQPVRTSNDDTATYFKVLDVDNALKDIGRTDNIYFVSNYDSMIDYLQRNPTVSINTVTKDDLHPNDAGYKILFEGLMKRLDLPLPKVEENKY